MVIRVRARQRAEVGRRGGGGRFCVQVDAGGWQEGGGEDALDRRGGQNDMQASRRSSFAGHLLCLFRIITVYIAKLSRSL